MMLKIHVIVISLIVVAALPVSAIPQDIERQQSSLYQEAELEAYHAVLNASAGGKHPAALRAAKRYLERFTQGEHELQVQLACVVLSDKAEDMIRYSRSVIQADPLSEETRTALGYLLNLSFALNRQSECLQWLQTNLERDDFDHVCRLFPAVIAMMIAKRDGFRQAKRFADRIEREVDDPEKRIWLAYTEICALMGMGKWKLAEVALERVVQEKMALQQQIAFWKLRSEIYSHTGKQEKVLQSETQTLDYAPYSLQAWQVQQER